VGEVARAHCDPADDDICHLLTQLDVPRPLRCWSAEIRKTNRRTKKAASSKYISILFGKFWWGQPVHPESFLGGREKREFRVEWPSEIWRVTT